MHLRFKKKIFKFFLSFPYLRFLLLFPLIPFIPSPSFGSPRHTLAAETDINLDGTPVEKHRSRFFIEGGPAYSIGSDLGIQPQFGGYLHFASAWQMGLHLRFPITDSYDRYDYFPETSLELRRLWLGDDGQGTMSNGEYFSLAVGAYHGYGFDGEKDGLGPLASIAIGKYWTLFETKNMQDWGFDTSIELSRLIQGHLVGGTDLVFLTLQISVYYLLP